MPTSDRAGCPRGSAAATPIYLSVSPFGADRLGEGARIARATGCAAVDVNVALLEGGERPAALADVPIGVLSVSWQSRRRADLPACVATARRLGVGTLNVYPTLAPGDDPAAVRAALVADVEAALEARGADGPLLTLENALERPPGLAATFDAWLSILKAVDSPHFRGNPDAANFIACGDAESLARVARDAAPWVGYVHAKGVVPFNAELHEREPFRRVWEGKGRWLAAPAGEGAPDYRELLGGLLRAGYRGAVGVEPFDCEAPIRSAVAFLRDVLRSCPGSGAAAGRSRWRDSTVVP